MELSQQDWERLRIDGVRRGDVQLAFVTDRHHCELLSRPTGDLALMVAEALAVRSDDNDAAWRAQWVGTHTPREAWQQLIVRLPDLKRSTIAGLQLKVLARSGSSAVRYCGVDSGRSDGWDGSIDLTAQWPDDGVTLFRPFTTSLLEIVLDRELHLFEGENKVARIRGGR